MSHEDDLDVGVLEFLSRGLAPVSPKGSLRERLLGLAGGVERFAPFLDRMMALFDLPEAAADAELRTIDTPEAWDDMVPGVRFRDFEGGPAIGDAHGGLVRVEPGGSFPEHEHIGEEAMLLLQGQVEDEKGNRYRAGDTIISASGTSHALANLGDEEVIYAARIIGLNFIADDDDDDDDDVDLD